MSPVSVPTESSNGTNGTNGSAAPAVTPANVNPQVQAQITLGGKIIASKQTSPIVESIQFLDFF